MPRTSNVDDRRPEILFAGEGEHALGRRGAPQRALRCVVHEPLDLRIVRWQALLQELKTAENVIEGEAVDLYRFTSVIMREVDEKGRLRISAPTSTDRAHWRDRQCAAASS
jgi:hypothetical protein